MFKELKNYLVLRAEPRELLEIAILALLILCFALTACKVNDASLSTEGDPAPDDIPATTGLPNGNVKEHRGTVLLCYWNTTEPSPCVPPVFVVRVFTRFLKGFIKK